MLKQGVSFMYSLHTNLEIVGKSQNTLPTNEKNTHDNTKTSLLVASHMWPLIWFEENLHTTLKSTTSSMH